MNIKDKLLLSAFDLFMKYGIKSVSMDDICRTLGVSKKTVYNVIANKKDLIDQILKAHLARDQKQINDIVDNATHAIDAMEKIGKHVLQFLRAMTPSLIYDLQKYYPESWSMIEEQHYGFIYETIKGNLIRGQQEGLYLNDFDSNIIARLYVEKTHCIADDETFPLVTYTRPQLFEELFMYHMRGITSKKGKAMLDNIRF